MLLQAWLAMAGWWRSAFAQDRSFLRVLRVLLGLLATRGVALLPLNGGLCPQQRVHGQGREQAMKPFRLIVAQTGVAENAVEIPQHRFLDG